MRLSSRIQTQRYRGRKLLLAGLGLTAAAGAALVTAAPASAVQPHVSVQTYQAYNHPDSYGQVQHWDKVGGKYLYGNWAPRGTWSNQSACWAGVTSYSYNFTS